MPTLTGVLQALTEGQRLRLQDVLLVLGVITATMAAADRLARRAWRVMMRPQLQQIITEVVRAETKELRVDGGESIKDAITEMRRDLVSIHERLGPKG